MATIELNQDNFAPTVEAEGITIVDFWADWCGPCKAFAPTFEKASEKHPDVTFAKVDTEANEQLAAALEIQAIPTLMLFRDGILLHRQSGALPPAAFEQFIEELKKVDMDEVRKQIAEQNNQ
ncbi:thioredoxin [Corynebacterium uterequi]|uniref:Thioredoxin n=1 Tax=Corynebacterium uterequi TaxID=1072256 RepID=A0A0G3HH96_9CORY|nr:thioredoxin [Corynebacterium uterequi]AKK12125.1 thioredoxin [Corynebacterium uterequi]